jgi:hypothetical protein
MPAKAIKRLRPNPLAELELHAGDLRVLYNVEGEEVVIRSTTRPSFPDRSVPLVGIGGLLSAPGNETPACPRVLALEQRRDVVR